MLIVCYHLSLKAVLLLLFLQFSSPAPSDTAAREADMEFVIMHDTDFDDDDKGWDKKSVRSSHSMKSHKSSTITDGTESVC